jgi:hypothetical protein
VSRDPARPALATPPPLVTNEAAVVVVGTALWAVALVVLLLMHDWLHRHDATWWIWVPVAGVAVGCTWGPYALWKRRRFHREMGLSDAVDGEPDGLEHGGGEPDVP